MLYQIAKTLLRFFFWIAFDIDVEGKENIPSEGGFITCSNHRTNLDPILVGTSIRHRLYFMAKDELFQNPLFGFILHHLGAFPVKRGQGDTSAIDRSIEILRDKMVLAMFPEGTRSKDGVPLRPKSGAALIAAQTKANILPVGITFSGKLRFRTHITIRIGKMIPNDDLRIESITSPKQLKYASQLIMENIVGLIDLPKTLPALEKKNGES